MHCKLCGFRNIPREGDRFGANESVWWIRCYVIFFFINFAFSLHLFRCSLYCHTLTFFVEFFCVPFIQVLPCLFTFTICLKWFLLIFVHLFRTNTTRVSVCWLSDLYFLGGHIIDWNPCRLLTWICSSLHNKVFSIVRSHPQSNVFHVAARTVVEKYSI